MQQYQISSLGFLPESCVKELPSGFQHFSSLLDHLSSPDTLKFRQCVHSLPPYDPNLYSINGLSRGQKQYLYSIITMIIQKYLWGEGTSTPIDLVPTELGAPLLELAQELGLQPALTYAGVIMYNWSLRDNTKPISLDNLKVNHKLREGAPYEWFCMIHAAIEAAGGKTIIPIFNIQRNIEENNIEAIKGTLKLVNEAIKACNVILFRMYENCSPDEFWNFRYYFEGTNDTNFFPKGLRIKGFEDRPIVVRGASGGQSTLMQIFDALFAVEHIGHGKGFLEEMRSYMPKDHQKFLQDFIKGTNLRKYVERINNEELTKVFLEGVDNFTIYRQGHYKIAHDYIFRMIQKDQIDVSVQKPESEKGLYKENETGTGGTNAPKFLQQTILETKATRNIRLCGEELMQEKKIEEKSDKKYEKEKNNKMTIKFKFDQRKLEDVLFSLIVAFAGSYLVRFLL